MRLSRTLSCLSALAALCGIAAAAPTQTAPEFAGPLPVSTLKKLLADEPLHSVKNVVDLPPAVRTAFRERVLTYDLNVPQGRSPRVTGSRYIDMANPGQPWAVGCIVDSTKPLPSRQLQFAGLGKGRCFVVYDTGGIAHMRHLTLFRLNGEQAVPIGSLSLRVNGETSDLAALRQNIAKAAM